MVFDFYYFLLDGFTSLLFDDLTGVFTFNGVSLFTGVFTCAETTFAALLTGVLFLEADFFAGDCFEADYIKK
jgi:hypothetical protein